MKTVGFQKVKEKIQDRMLLGSIYDNIMMQVKYTDELSRIYNIMIGQKHRMLYYKRLKKEYLNRCTVSREWELKEKEFHPEKVWFCWLQGIDEAPLLVKRCLESLRKNMPDKEIIIIDQNNVFEYVSMPEHIISKWKKGIIGSAHFTDMLRLELLIQNGGYWIDSTVLCTDASLCKYLDTEPLFMYSFYYFGFNPEIMELNNWFIHSTTNNNILCLQREFLYEYWKDYDRALNYFFFQIFMTMAVSFYRKDYMNMPIISQVDAHVLASNISMPYDEKKFEIMKLSTGFHKLSTRFNPKRLGPGTFYDRVIRQEGNGEQNE